MLGDTERAVRSPARGTAWTAGQLRDAVCRRGDGGEALSRFIPASHEDRIGADERQQANGNEHHGDDQLDDAEAARDAPADVHSVFVHGAARYIVGRCAPAPRECSTERYIALAAALTLSDVNVDVVDIIH